MIDLIGITADRFRYAQQRLLSLPHVTGVGIGWKEIQGRITDDPVLRVYVRRKFPRHDLKPVDIVPGRVEGSDTDVVSCQTGVPAVGMDIFAAPLTSGCLVSNLRGVLHDPSIHHQASGLGTLGFFAIINGNRRREVVLVTSRHVLLAHGAGCGAPIYNPIFSQRGENGVIRRYSLEPVATIVHEGAEGNHLFQYAGEQPAEYFVDCAAARMLVEPSVPRFIPGDGIGSHVLLRGVARMHPLDAVGGRAPRVRKIGGATGTTFGRVVDVAAPVEVSSSPTRLNNLVIRGVGDSFVEPGDSGALVLNDRDEAVGIVWGRNDRDPRVAYACHIHPVLDRLDVTPMTGGLA